MYNVLQCFVQIWRSYKVIKLWIQPKRRHTHECEKHFTSWFSLNFFVRFIEKKPSIMFYGVFVHFSWTYGVAKFWVIKLYLNVSDVIHTSKHKKYANCGLSVNFWGFLLMSFCFVIKNHHLKQNLLLWPIRFLLINGEILWWIQCKEISWNFTRWWDIISKQNKPAIFVIFHPEYLVNTLGWKYLFLFL